MPKWGVSKSDYFFDRERHSIAKGLSSVKYMNNKVAEEMYELAHSGKTETFIDVLRGLDNTSINSRQLDILIKIDFFSDFGNQRELLRIVEIYSEIFKKGQAKQVSRTKIEGTPLDEIVKKYAVGFTKSGAISKSYTLLDIDSILYEAEKAVLESGMSDLDDAVKVKNFAEVMGYIGYISGNEEDRRKLYVSDIYPLFRKKDNKQFGYSFITKSIGSGVESRFTVVNSVYDKEPVSKGDIIMCLGWERNGQYFRMNSYKKIG